jgi:hypothetical protein
LIPHTELTTTPPSELLLIRVVRAFDGFAHDCMSSVS